ncbi:MAG: hypothetical protein ABUS79_04260 [Pseudomonadota bacterium]
MTRGRRMWGALTSALVLFAPVAARAFPDYVGARALGMGGAGRADARGDEGPLLNPAGMSLGRLYTVDAAYQFMTRDGGHVIHGSAVDSTSAFHIAGGLFYNYRTASVTGLPRLAGHEAGLALSYPIGDMVMIGATGKYLHLAGGSPDATGTTGKISGITADAGLIVRVGSMLTIGVAGYNLRDLRTRQAPVGVGYGLAFNPGSKLMVVVDGLHDFTTTDTARGVLTTVAGGAEYTFEQKVVVRLGGGRDGVAARGFVSAGAAVMSELGAVDLGVRQDVSGDRKVTVLSAGLRLFVPSP